MGNLEVMVVGAGAGGLSLAHGLRAEGVVRVFEGDRTPVDRARGYRVTINAGGARALQSCLPKANFERYIESSAKISTAVSFFDHKLHRLLAIELPTTSQSASDGARPISCIALRQILLEGLEDAVEFGKTFEGFGTTPKGPQNEIARFGVLKLPVPAISSASAAEKQTPAQSLRGLFTDNYLSRTTRKPFV
jgi:2-polyprenyl-6-methoxyphenol hydroxylase-like FAD-dependent oxidoreductase